MGRPGGRVHLEGFSEESVKLGLEARKEPAMGGRRAGEFPAEGTAQGPEEGKAWPLLGMCPRLPWLGQHGGGARMQDYCHLIKDKHPGRNETANTLACRLLQEVFQAGTAASLGLLPWPHLAAITCGSAS